jgi:hypothetical protein
MEYTALIREEEGHLTCTVTSPPVEDHGQSFRGAHPLDPEQAFIELGQNTQLVFGAQTTTIGLAMTKFVGYLYSEPLSFASTSAKEPTVTIMHTMVALVLGMLHPSTRSKLRAIQGIPATASPITAVDGLVQRTQTMMPARQLVPLLPIIMVPGGTVAVIIAT